MPLQHAPTCSMLSCVLPMCKTHKPAPFSLHSMFKAHYKCQIIVIIIIIIYLYGVSSINAKKKKNSEQLLTSGLELIISSAKTCILV